MSVSRRLLLLLLLACTNVAAATPVPPLLEPWRDWVLADEPWRRCAPLIDLGLDHQEGRICAWPGALRIEASATGARFSQRWTLQAPGLVPLPGDARHRPLDVQRDGRAIEVLMVGGAPTLQLEAGEHAISGRFAWQRRPETLAVPQATALLSLELDGRAVVPVERRDGRLWLGRGETQAETEALAVRVFRRVDDGVPLRLNTEFQLDVAGRAREQVLGIALPPGFLPVSLSSSLPAKLDAEGRLHVQLRPGSWRLHLHARAAGAEGAQLGPVAQPAPWPEEEIWSFRGKAELRVVQPEGLRPVDPDQVGAPWGEPLPSFALGPDERLGLAEVSRGRDPDLPHRLHLQRELWLDFSGDGYTARDRVSGQLASVGRLDLGAPWELRRAAQEGEDLLVTRGADGASGVELRSLQVDLDATARHEAGRLHGATGWQQDFESASLRLHLPPGWKLLAAGGADQAPGAWIERWTLLDLFWLSVLSLLAHRLGGWMLALPLGAALVLGWHESGLPVGWLSLALVLGLLAGLLRAGRLNTLLRWARGAALLALLLFALPFVGTQLQWALFPQLERGEIGRAGEVDRYDYAEAAVADMPVPQAAIEAPPPAPPAPAAPPVPRADEAQLETVVVTGARIKSAEANVYRQQANLNRYPKDAVVQAGLGLPDWSWASQSIRWDGPVTAEQGLSLWLTPPWLTALWRLALCGLLALVLLRLLRPRDAAGAGWLRGPAAAGLLLAVLPLQASEVPSAELLTQLRERLVQPPPCGSQCAALGRVELQVVDGELRLALDWHAAAPAAVPLPQTSSRWQPSRLQMNGRDAEAAYRDGRHWLRLERGLQRVSIAGPLGGLDSLDLQLPHLPAELQVVAPGWEVAGLVDGRLQSNSLQLVRAAERGATGAPLGGSEFPPFVEVSRTLNLDLEWTLSTVVRRIAPEQGGFSIAVPLLDGEQPLEEELVVRDGQAQLSFGAGVEVIRWQSRLPVTPAITLAAPALDRFAEYWEVAVGPFWSVAVDGPPELNLGGGDGWRRFRPLPGETLTLSVQRPEALRGGSVAIDQATASWRLGQRSAEVTLDFRARATRGGQHVLSLPEGAELVSVSLRGETQNLRLQGNRLSLPLLPGENHVAIAFRRDGERGLTARAEGIDLGTDSANLRTEVAPGEGRWLLWASGDGVGPVVLYWPQLLLMVLAAWLLARYAPTPLRWPHWLLLGLGFSTVSWWAALVVAAWLIALGWRAGHPPRPEQRWRFIGVQLGLVALTAVALLCLLAAIPYGLLGDPDMQVAGNGSSAWQLVAFLDRSPGALPALSLFALPLWLYKAAILLWSLWLANALLGWLRWGIEALRRGGAWPPRKAAVVADQPAEAAPPAAEA